MLQKPSYNFWKNLGLAVTVISLVTGMADLAKGEGPVKNQPPHPDSQMTAGPESDTSARGIRPETNYTANITSLQGNNTTADTTPMKHETDYTTCRNNFLIGLTVVILVLAFLLVCRILTTQ